MATAAVINFRLIRGKALSVRIVPMKNHDPNSRDTRFVCLPCQPRPAAWANGFSISGAVSTKTFTSALATLANHVAIFLSLPLTTS